ncbi:MAG: transcriptional repressor [Phycisphaerales bacterium]|jgi:Fur family ferric uptake transcriptional regulator|nr:transcriptional repressor [Phycisphaerales bacterium]
MPTSITITEPACAVFRRHLRSVGLKYTPERARVLDGVLGTSGPFLVDDLVRALAEGEPAVSKATAYRTIKLLTESGLLQRLLLTGEQSHYQLALPTGHSAVIVQTDSGAAEAVDLPAGVREAAEKLAASRGLRVEHVQLIVHAAVK